MIRSFQEAVESITEAVDKFCEAAPPSQNTPLLDALKTFETDLNFANRSTVYVTQLFVSDTGFRPHKNDSPPPDVTTFPSAKAARDATPKKMHLRGSDTAVGDH